MEAKELRIDNWVMYDGHPYQIDYIEAHQIDLKRGLIPKILTGHLLPKDINPIPLSKKVLSKCQFIEKCFVENDKILVFSRDNDDYFSTIVGINKHEIKYLHELQNLYYALTKTELTYNL